MSCHPLRELLLDVAPELRPKTPDGLARLDRFLVLAAQRVNRCAYGDNADLATVYQAAHMLAMSARAGAGAVGPVTSEKVGDLARTYAASAGGQGGPAPATTYQALLAELDASISTVGAFVV